MSPVSSDAAAADAGAEQGASLLRQHPPPSPHPIPHQVNSHGGSQKNAKVLIDGFQPEPNEYDVDCDEVKNSIRSTTLLFYSKAFVNVSVQYIDPYELNSASFGALSNRNRNRETSTVP